MSAFPRSRNKHENQSRHAGYDHGYYFIATFIADHLAFHSADLTR